MQEEKREGGLRVMWREGEMEGHSWRRDREGGEDQRREGES